MNNANFSMRFALGNSAFREMDNDDATNLTAVAEILEGVARKIRNDDRYGAIVDKNGNRVGEWSIDD